jgi:lysine 6-dehydrogenase
MKILLLGVGLQGKAALFDLVNSQDVSRVIAVDQNYPDLVQFVDRLKTNKVEPAALNADDESGIVHLLMQVDAVIALLPTSYNPAVARLAVENGVHFVNSSYTPQEFTPIGQMAEKAGVSILPEFGFDPGIDLVLAGQAVRELDQVEAYFSYGSGVPEPKAADGPLKYKISWSFRWVLNAYQRPGRIVRAGEVVEIPGREIFAPSNMHMVNFPGWGSMEAYPNGDVVGFLDTLGIKETAKDAGRYATRWPGHCAFWYALAQLGFLDQTLIQVGQVQVSPREFVANLLEPQLQYNDQERDLAIIQIDVRGTRNGVPRRIVYTVAGLRDLESGLMAMTRMVGFTTSIGAQMILRGDITKRGLLSPLNDVPFDLFVKELEKRDILVDRREE